MPESNVCHSKYKGHSPYSLLKEEHVVEALFTEFGHGAELLTWEVEDFTKKGDNYSSTVTSVKASYETNGIQSDAYYIAKFNPLREITPLNEIIRQAFVKEPLVLKYLVTMINERLEENQITRILLPKVFSTTLHPRNECFLMEDFRKRGFVMFDRRKGMDIAHVLLVMKELAKLHAGSLLVQDEVEGKDLRNAFPCLKEPWLENLDSSVMQVFGNMLRAHYEAAVNFFENIYGYECTYEWFKTQRTQPISLYSDMILNTEPRYLVLTHGDCWNNNILFRYNERKEPVTVCFVDLQVSRRASFALDITYFLYTSLNGETRRKNMEHFIQEYYKAFYGTLELCGREAPFTFEQCKMEVRRKLPFGGMSAAFLLPMMLAQEEKEEDVSSNKCGFEEFSKHNVSMYGNLKNQEGIYKDRFLSVYDDMQLYNVL